MKARDAVLAEIPTWTPGIRVLVTIGRTFAIAILVERPLAVRPWGSLGSTRRWRSFLILIFLILLLFIGNLQAGPLLILTLGAWGRALVCLIVTLLDHIDQLLDHLTQLVNVVAQPPNLVGQV